MDDIISKCRRRYTINLKLNLLNNLQFNHVDKERFPVVKILDKLRNNHSLFETIIVSANDTLVNLYLEKKITFNEISSILLMFIKKKQFHKYKYIKPKKIQNIIDLDRYVRSKSTQYVYNLKNV